MKLNWSYSPKTPNLDQNRRFFIPCDLKIWQMTWKTIGHLSLPTSSFVHYFVAIGEFKLELQSGNSKFGSKSAIFLSPVTFKFNLTDYLENNRAPLLGYFKLLQSHQWIQTGVAVRKRLNSGLTYVTLTFDLWPWPFAWTSLLSMVITPENFIKIRWEEHSEKGCHRQTDRQTDRRAEVFLELLVRS